MTLAGLFVGSDLHDPQRHPASQATPHVNHAIGALAPLDADRAVVVAHDVQVGMARCHEVRTQSSPRRPRFVPLGLASHRRRVRARRFVVGFAAVVLP